MEIYVVVFKKKTVLSSILIEQLHQSNAHLDKFIQDPYSISLCTIGFLFSLKICKYFYMLTEISHTYIYVHYNYAIYIHHVVC